MITTWTRGRADAHMDEAILTELGPLVARHPWWQARTRLTTALLERLEVRPPARVLDVGCGWGVTLEALERRGYRATGLDVSRRALERLDRPGRDLIEADLTQDLASTETYDAVLALDVIEHLDDDRSAVSRLGRLVRPGGVVIVSVPAGPELFGEFDAVQGHRRRYLPDALQTTFSDSGLEIRSVLWWGAWLLPLLRRRRGRSLGRPGETAAQVYRRHLRLPSRPAVWALRLAFATELPWAVRGRLQTGSSLFVTAGRP